MRLSLAILLALHILAHKKNVIIIMIHLISDLCLWIFDRLQTAMCLKAEYPQRPCCRIKIPNLHPCRLLYCLKLDAGACTTTSSCKITGEKTYLLLSDSNLSLLSSGTDHSPDITVNWCTLLKKLRYDVATNTKYFNSTYLSSAAMFAEWQLFYTKVW